MPLQWQLCSNDNEFGSRDDLVRHQRKTPHYNFFCPTILCVFANSDQLAMFTAIDAVLRVRSKKVQTNRNIQTRRTVNVATSAQLTVRLKQYPETQRNSMHGESHCCHLIAAFKLFSPWYFKLILSASSRNFSDKSYS